MQPRHRLIELPARIAAWLRSVVAPQIVPPARKLTPIDQVLARIGREPPTAD
jgi:hypothetical protein